VPVGTSLQLKNVAAVMVTASLPAFAQPGQTIDITVSSIGNAKSLRGGTLVMTPLQGADNQVYAMAQGNVLVGGVGVAAGGAQLQVNHLSVGKISGGATVERAVANSLGADNQIRLELNSTDFLTASECTGGISTTEWDTQGHGSHVGGTIAGDNFANPITHDPGDGMAPV